MKWKLFSLLLVALISTFAKGEKISTAEYIKAYKSTAIKEMKAYKIPASITLAQGVLESGSGNSDLASKANNHFGIKCHRDWDGRKVYHDDDEKNECFRAYDDPKESFRDHSLFLKNRSRYAFLFEKDITDYKGWAKGLKKAGYATNPKYPQLLIKIIEEHKLYQYDSDDFDDEEEILEIDLSAALIRTSSNRVKYITIKEGDTFENLAYETENNPEDLLDYNELNYDAQIKVGDILYIQPKKRKSARDFKVHVAKKGETMYSISQKYAVKLKYLYKRNNLKIGHKPKAGDRIKLR